MVKSNWRASARAVGTLSAMATELPHLIWIDCEMTGLNLATDALVEIAVLVTDSELNVIGEGVDVVIHATQGQLDAMNDYVKNMHTASGLITEIPSGISVSAAEEKILEYLHYRTIDVSSIKELARRWHPKTYFASPAKTGNHRALGDIQDSIAELAYYRTALFVNPANNSTPEEISG